MSQFRVENSFNNGTNCFNTTVNYYLCSGDERAEILAWLSPLEPQIRHNDIRARRVKDVGDWVFQTEGYQNWFRGICSENSALFCYGDPGVGKTYLR